MKAVVANGYGTSDVLQVAEVEMPKPLKNQFRVKVISSAVTRADAMMRTGKPRIARLFIGLKKPKKEIPGTGFAGVIEEIGENVSRFKVGDRVFGETAFGFRANAEYLVVAENDIVLHLPENIHFTEASSFCDGHLTSYNFLKNIAKIEAGQKVLINGASGALGMSAVQLAKYFGAEVTGVCSARNLGLVRSLGADYVINYNEIDFTKNNKKYDVIYDTIGKSSFAESKSVLTDSGLYMSPVLNMRLLMQMIKTSITKGKKALFQATGTNKPKKLKKWLSEVLEIYKEGHITTYIDRQYPLEKLAEAHDYIDTGRKRGNVVIINSENESILSSEVIR